MIGWKFVNFCPKLMDFPVPSEVTPGVITCASRFRTVTRQIEMSKLWMVLLDGHGTRNCSPKNQQGVLCQMQMQHSVD